MIDSYRRVVFTGDILRPANHDYTRSNQVENTRWLYNILRRFVEVASNKPVDLVTWEPGSFDAQKFYALNGLDTTIDSWTFLHCAEMVSEEAYAYIRPFFEGAFVIGFEIHPLVAKIINSLGGTYLDATIHPIRYLDDIFLGFRTNSKDLYEKISHYMAREEDFYYYAGLHQAMMTKTKLPRFTPDTAVFVGQTDVDRSLIVGPHLIEAKDFALERIFAQHPLVLYKKHPLCSNPRHENYILEYSNCQPTDLNLYALMCHPDVSTFIGISSGGITESAYFGKKSVFLSEPSVKLATPGTPYNSKTFVGINGDYFKDIFWNDVFETKSMSRFELNFRPNRLRHALNSYWGYDFLNSK